MDERGIEKVSDIVGKVVLKYFDWGNLDFNYKVVVCIDLDMCINCNKCYIFCEDIFY